MKTILLFAAALFIESCAVPAPSGSPATPPPPDQILPRMPPEASADLPPEAQPEAQPDPQPQPHSPSEPRQRIVRFVVLGDGGEGNAEQYQVADAMETLCDLKGGCEFALYLGDNFYDDGILLLRGLDDPQFQDKFEFPYANLDFPFYVVLGNHDYGLLSVVSQKANLQVLYHDLSERWHMPDRYYSVVHEHVALWGLDTNAFMVGSLMPDVHQDAQAQWFNQEVDRAPQTWKIAFGHHPLRSNGSHGNAGDYEGSSWLPFASGRALETFMLDSFCDRIDVYFSGHDHNRQWLHTTCGVELVVSGAAAKTTDLGEPLNDVYFQDDQTPGFLFVEIVDDVLTGEFYNMNGDLDFTRTITRPPSRPRLP